ncbi:hypothetical protein EJB05_48877, partial [Eragrostis curvula]
MQTASSPTSHRQQPCFRDTRKSRGHSTPLLCSVPCPPPLLPLARFIFLSFASSFLPSSPRAPLAAIIPRAVPMAMAASSFVPVLLLLVLSSAPFLAFSSEPLNPEVEALIAIRQGLVDPHGVLSNWDQDSVDPCSWAMITCSAQNLVIGLGAPSQGLSGTLSGRIANLTHLEQVLLQNNNITGRLPPELGALPRLQTLDLSNNRFSGRVPDTLGRLTALRYLCVSLLPPSSRNIPSSIFLWFPFSCTASVTDALLVLPCLCRRRLNNNSLSGAFPASLAKIPQLAFLDLSYNNLTGPVPVFPTRTFNIVGNPMICGGSNGSAGECAAALAPVNVPFPLESTPGSSRTGEAAAAAASARSKAGSRLPIGVGTSLGASSLVLFAVSCFLWRRKRRHSGPSSVLGILERGGSDLEDGGGGVVVARLGNLRQFGLRELQSATDGFNPKNILGKGGFGNVYRGRLPDGTTVAVKRLKDPASASGEAQFRTEVEMISLAVHRHLLRLVGFCAASGERILVYPYMPNGSEKMLDLLVDQDLGPHYDRIEVAEMVQVALLCTQFQPSHRPKMSEVVRMLEGDGLAEKWEATNRPAAAAASVHDALGYDHRNDSNGSVFFNDFYHENDSSLSSDEARSIDMVEEMELSGPRINTELLVSEWE